MDSSQSRRQFLQAGLALSAAGIVAPNGANAASGQSPASGRYSDVNDGDWFYAAVDFVSNRRLMDSSGRDFNPGAAADRATVATALYRMAGSPPVKFEPVFTDVPSGLWYSDAVIWATESGILAGYGDGRFGPNDGISRQRFAAGIFRYADIKFPQASGLDGFTDRGGISEWAEAGMGWCVARGIIAATAGAALEPDGSLTRAQCAASLQRFANLREDPGNIWVLNPRPTKPPVETAGLAPRVEGGWAGKTVAAMSNYNAHLSSVFGAEIEDQIKNTLSPGETVRFIFIGDLTVIRFQTIDPSYAPNENWEYMDYEAFLASVEAGTIKPDAVIVGGGF